MDHRLMRGGAVMAATLCIICLLLGCHGGQEALVGGPPGRTNPAADFAQRLVGEWDSASVVKYVWTTDHVSFREPTNSAQGTALLQVVVSESGELTGKGLALGAMSWGGDLVIDSVVGDSAQATLNVTSGSEIGRKLEYADWWVFPIVGNTCSATLTFSGGDDRLNMNLLGIGGEWPDKFEVEMGKGPDRTYVLGRDANTRAPDSIHDFVHSVVGAWDLGFVKEPGALVSGPATPVVMTLRSEVNTVDALIPGVGSELNYLWEENSHRHEGRISITLACGHSANVILDGGGMPNAATHHPGLTAEGTMSVSEDGDVLTVGELQYDGAHVKGFTRR